MKTIRYTIPAVVALLLSTSCSQEDIDSYNPSYEALNIGFGSVSSLSEDATFNYSETTGERGLKFYARVTGTPSDQDRTFTLEASGADLDKVKGSFRCDTYVIPAGEVSGEYYIYFDPSKLTDPAVFTTTDGEIVFTVGESSSFEKGAKGQNQLCIKLKNALAMPEDWYTPTGGYRQLSLYFGDYSSEKFQFMIENGCPVNFRVSYNQTANIALDGDVTIINNNYANYLVQVFQLALEEYNEAHPDNHLCDRTGNPITF